MTDRIDAKLLCAKGAKKPMPSLVQPSFTSGLVE
jgi:hypothetical protein